MSNKITIEPATETDLPLVKSLLLELLEAIENAKGLNVEQAIENYRIFVEDTAHYMLLARDGDSVLGFVNFTTRRTIMHPCPSGLIDELIVSKRVRSSGIGKRLVMGAINKCRELGCCEVEVSTEKSNVKARRFYKACGFEEDAVLLEIDLGEHSNE